jgi:CzcA family heavy metal efflux pump
MTYSTWLWAHRRSVIFFFLALIFSGVFAGFSLPVSLFPQVSFPRIVISLESGDRPSEQMALLITQPIEEAVRAIPGVRSVRSNTSRGAAEVLVGFDWGSDMTAALLQSEAAVQQGLGANAGTVSFEARRMDPTVFPVMAYSLTSTKRPLTELKDIARLQLRPLLSSVEGVAKIAVVGGEDPEYQITASPERLSAYQLTLQDLSDKISQSQAIQAIGRLEDHYRLYLVASDSGPTDKESLEGLIIAHSNGGVIRLKDVATVEEATTPEWVKVTADGRSAVLFQVHQQPDGNTVAIEDEIGQRLAEYRNKLPSDVKISKWYDQSTLIVDAAKSVRDAIWIGVALAALVLLFFLRNYKITLIASLMVPAVLAITVLILYSLGLSFNIMTLGGMAAAVGLIIDDAIVIVEHIVRRLHKEPHNQNVALDASWEFTRSLLGSSGATLVIHIPLAFLSGVTGAFFRSLSLTMAVSLFVSFFFAWLVIPLLSRWVLRSDEEMNEDGKLTRLIHGVYAWVMRGFLAHPWWGLAWSLALVSVGLGAFQRVGSGFMPKMDEGGFILDYLSASGTSLAETDRLLQKVEEIIQENPSVETYSRRAGVQLGGALTEANEGDFFIKLKPFPRPPIEEVIEEIRGQVNEEVPGLEIETVLLMEDLIGDLTSVPQPIEVKLFCDDQALLQETSPKIVALLEKVSGVIEIADGSRVAGDAVVISVDETRAQLQGLSTKEIIAQATAALDGTIPIEIPKGPRTVPVRVWLPKEARHTTDQVEALVLRSPDGHLLTLGRVAHVDLVAGQPEIHRENLKRMLPVTARLVGRSLGEASAEIKEKLSAPGALPPGVYFELGGIYHEQQQAFHSLLGVFFAALVLVFFLLLVLYERLRIALSVTLVSLLSLTGVFWGLYLTDTELNISSMTGMIMVLGSVTEVAIFYFSEYVSLCQEGTSLEPLIDAGKNRMRPIVMTTLAAILALLPLALGLGRGAAMLLPLAITIISGLIVQLPLVLLLMPSLFAFMRGDAPQNKPSAPATD